MKKGIMKRLAAAGLSIVTLLGMSTSVMAAGETPGENPGASGKTAVCLSDAKAGTDGYVDARGTITVTGIGSVVKDGVTTYDKIQTYKIVTIKYDKTHNNVEYAWANDEVKKAANSIVNKENLTVKEFVDAYNGNETSAKAKYAEHVYSAILKVVNTNPEAFETSEVKSGESVEFTDVAMGQYIVKATGNNVYAAMTATLDPKQGEENNTLSPDTNKYYLYDAVKIVAKTSLPTLHKNIVVTNEKDEENLVKVDTVTTGGTVDLQVDVTAPNFPEDAVDKTFTVTDDVHTGLIGARDLTITSNKRTLEEGKLVDGKVEDGKDYAVEYYDKDGNVLTGEDAPKKAYKYKVTFNMDVTDINGSNDIKIRYTSDVTTDFKDVDLSENYTADATLNWPDNTWSTKNDLNAITEGVRVYTFGIDGLKFAKDTGKGLEGAEFKLYDTEKMGTGTALKFESFTDTDGLVKYVVSSSEDAKETITTSTDGKFYIYGLGTANEENGDVKAKTYYLEETKAPMNYTLLTSRQAVEIKPIVNEAKTKITGVDKSSTNDKLNNHLYYAVANIANEKGFTLPKTGDTAMFFMSIAGVAIALLGIAFFVFSRRRYSKEN